MRTLSPYRASSATSTTSTMGSRLSTASRAVVQITERKPALSISLATVAASRPTGIKTKTTPFGVSISSIVPTHQRRLLPFVHRRACENTAKTLEWRSDDNALTAELEFPDGMFVLTASFLQEGECAPHAAIELEIAQHQHAIGEIADVEGRIHRSEHAMLREHQNGKDPELTEVAQQLVHLQDQEALVRHRVQVAIEAVDDHDTRVSGFSAAAYGIGKLARRHFGRVDLLNIDQAVVEALLKRKSQRLGARTHRAASFIEGKDHGFLPSRSGGDRIGKRQR